MSEAIHQYQQALKDRRNGVVSELGPDATWLDIKPDFYADARILSEDGLQVFNSFTETHPPYGLVEHNGEAVTKLEHPYGPWYALFNAVRTTGHAAIALAQPSISACPYHQPMFEKLGGPKMPMPALDHNEHGLDDLRKIVEPGAVLNSSFLVSLVRRLPDVQKLHGGQTDPESFAHNSVGLLREPLSHPQQYAEAFIWCLSTMPQLLTDGFLDDKLAKEFTKIETTPDGGEHLAWAKSTYDLRLKTSTKIKSRIISSERNPDDSNDTRYPAGTRLGDIQTDEPTLGCPGNLLASAIYHRVIDVVVAESLWSKLERPTD